VGNERERNRIKSRVDEFPEDIKQVLHQRLADVNCSYIAIAEELTGMGYEISKSSVGRYAMRQGGAAKRFKESAEKIKALAEVVKENRDIEASEVASSLLMDLLIERVATAQEEIDEMPLDKAGRLIVQMQRSAVFKAKFKLEFDKGYQEAVSRVKKELAEELQKEPELLARMVELAERVRTRLEEE
jgi:hypothetical protein